MDRVNQTEDILYEHKVSFLLGNFWLCNQKKNMLMCGFLMSKLALVPGLQCFKPWFQ